MLLNFTFFFSPLHKSFNDLLTPEVLDLNAPIDTFLLFRINFLSLLSGCFQTSVENSPVSISLSLEAKTIVISHTLSEDLYNSLLIAVKIRFYEESEFISYFWVNLTCGNFGVKNGLPALACKKFTLETILPCYGPPPINKFINMSIKLLSHPRLFLQSLKSIIQITASY